MASRDIDCFSGFFDNGRSRPSDKGGGSGHPDLEIRGEGELFWLFRPQFNLKIRGGGPPLDPPLFEVGSQIYFLSLVWR